MNIFVEFGIDNIFYITCTEIPAQLTTRLVARLKIIAKLDIAERRFPQDRFQLHQFIIRIILPYPVWQCFAFLNANNAVLDIYH